DRLTAGYTAGVTFFVRRFVIGLLIFAGILGGTAYMFMKIPGSLIPDEDQGVLLTVGILPPAASLSRTETVLDQASRNCRTHPAVENVFAISGFDLLSGGQKTSAGAAFVSLKDWHERAAPELDARKLTGPFMGMNAGIKDGMILAFNPPPIMG